MNRDDASRASNTTAPAQSALRRRTRGLVATAALAIVAAGATAAGCGGTTGLEEMPSRPLEDGGGGGAVSVPKPDATLPTDGSTVSDAGGRPDGTTSVGDAGKTPDATSAPDGPNDDLDEGLFDVPIVYADRVLPDVQPPVDAGAIDWPNCAPDLAIDSNDGGYTDPEHGYPILPAQYDKAGNAAPAPDGSVCATHAWLGQRDWDECVRQGESLPTLPPCNGLEDAGNAVKGPGTGTPLFRLCQNLSLCIVRAGCGLADVTECLCGRGNITQEQCKAHWGEGPCWNDELAALQVDPKSDDAVISALSNFTSFADPGYRSAAALNQLYVLGFNNSCFPLSDAGAD